MIRPAELRDLERLQAIERAAGAAFHDIGMDAIADDQPLSLSDLMAYQADGRAWVAVPDDAEDEVAVAYALADVVDDAAHLEQVSVDPEFAHRGWGSRLIDAVAEWAAEQALGSVTLTTFAEVPWNAPYYGRLGFQVVLPEAGSGLAAVRLREHAPWARRLAAALHATCGDPVLGPVNSSAWPTPLLPGACSRTVGPLQQ